MKQATLGLHRLEQDGIGWHSLENTGILNLTERVWHLLFCFVFHVYRHKQIILFFFDCVKQCVILFSLVMSGLQWGYLYREHCTLYCTREHQSCTIAAWWGPMRRELLQAAHTVYSVQCTVYSVQCTVYTVHCTVCTVQYKVYSIKCTVYSLQYTVYIVQCTVHSIQCSVYGVQ